MQMTVISFHLARVSVFLFTPLQHLRGALVAIHEVLPHRKCVAARLGALRRGCKSSGHAPLAMQAKRPSRSSLPWAMCMVQMTLGSAKKRAALTMRHGRVLQLLVHKAPTWCKGCS